MCSSTEQAETSSKRANFMKIAAVPAVLAITMVVVLITFVGGDNDDVSTASATASSTTTAPAIALVDEVESDSTNALPTPATGVIAEVEISDYPFANGRLITPELQEEAAIARAEAVAIRTDAADAEAAAPTVLNAPSPAAQPITISSPPCGSLNAATNRTAPFTGVTAAIPSGLPAVVVKVSNNSSASRAALIGLDQADIVFEERIEASATRFFSVFHSSLPPNVGPVRSGRTTDIQLTENLNNPIFGYSGSNQGIARQINFAASNGLLTPFPNTDRSPFVRDGRFRAPDNLFVSPAGLGACGGGSPTAIFRYGPNNSTTARSASTVSFSARSSYRFDWNGSTWTRSQSGSQHVTRDGAALAPENVVVLFVPYTQSQIDANSVDAVTVGSGEAWVLRDGTITTGGYTRARGHDPYTLTDGNGSSINLAPGQTWVVLAPAGTASFG